MSDVLAIFCADIHLSHTPPSARSAEPDWYAAMARPLRQLRELQEEHGCPVVCAGDVFDRWNSPPELVNFAINNLPKMYAIPGQHDLPHHRIEEIRRSAYWTLVEAGVILDVEDWDRPDDLVLHPFPWGAELTLVASRDGGWRHVAVAHRFVWSRPEDKHEGAPDDQFVGALKRKLKGYDLAVFGDNHCPFESGKVFNCGCLIRRRRNERGYRPSIGLLKADGTMERRYLDVSGDAWLEEAADEPEAAGPDGMDEFLSELGSLGPDALDFREAVRWWLESNEVGDPAREMIEEVLG